jgi:4,5-DOPA dioxygenase extradiol
VLIVGSGNVVHNLRRISWEPEARPYEWALEFDDWVKTKLLACDVKALTSSYLESQAGKLSVPTPDHYYPLLTALGAVEDGDEIAFPYEGLQNASISMRAVRFG